MRSEQSRFPEDSIRNRQNKPTYEYTGGMTTWKLQKCRELGYEVYDMDLITAGEEFYATMRRSTNGGGENSPMLEGEDDFYELFFAGLE